MWSLSQWAVWLLLAQLWMWKCGLALHCAMDEYFIDDPSVINFTIPHPLKALNATKLRSTDGRRVPLQRRPPSSSFDRNVRESARYLGGYLQDLHGSMDALHREMALGADPKEALLRHVVSRIARSVFAAAGCVAAPPSPSPILYVITPTYRRPEQMAVLTSLSQTLLHVRNLLWIVVEDAKSTTTDVKKFLDHTGVPFVHLASPMPERYKKLRLKPKGVSNRNRALEWLRANARNGVFYFADDDNVYDIRLFEEIRSTKKVSMWPVGMLQNDGLSSPIVQNGKFAGFYNGWIGGRKYPVDMAGFAVSVDYLLKSPRANMPYKPGFEEDEFLKSLLPFSPEEMELKAQNCTKVLVWHTQIIRFRGDVPVDFTQYDNTNVKLLKRQIVYQK